MSVGIGDLKTLFDVGYNFYFTLDEVQGSTAQYQATKSDIDQWAAFLKDVEGTLALPQADEVRQKIQRDVDSCYAMLDAVRGMISKSFLENTQKLLGSIPPRPGYTSDNAIIIIDALGKRLTWPTAVCKPWEQFSTSLQNHFKDKCGESFVRRGDYHSYCDDGRTEINLDEWESTVECGMTLEMTMVVQEDTTAGWLECSWCAKLFKITEYDQDPRLLEFPYYGEEREMIRRSSRGELAHFIRIDVLVPEPYKFDVPSEFTMGKVMGFLQATESNNSLESFFALARGSAP
ncbi:hypothetical protein FA95DRAFT_1676941 [Auriscalpium vulgare]|uniref:Uncharacterized protein n=1 Tax=Auriscalpium vulgare TaxID=40419 RepID=A0ACB8S2D1_9AGAM|nr:hypothetical protein FA95DRAFT_1676941 [Auriscalpium vulgare]